MKKKLIVVLCLVMALTMVLAGCGKKEEPAGNDTPVAEKSEITVAVTADFDSIDPQIMLASDTDRIMYNVYEGLVKCGLDGNIKPGLAESWTFDGDTLVMQIRKGVKFHDGSELTADDVVYSYKRICGMLDDQSATKQDFQEGIASVEKTGDMEVTLKLAKTNTAFESKLVVGILKADSGLGIVENPNGTGPYKLVSYEPGVGCTLEKHEDYWGDKAYIDTVNVKIYSDSTAALLAMQNGEIQMSAVAQSNLEMVPSNYDLLFVSNNTPVLVQTNCKEGPFADVEVRKALNYATDAQRLIDAVVPGSARVSNYLTDLQGFYKVDYTGVYPHDPEKAKATLAAAGYTAPVDFTLMYFSNLSNQYKDMAVILQDDWNKAGFNCTIEDVDWSTFLSTVYSNPERKFDAALFGYTGKLDPYQQFRRLQSTNTSNVLQWSSPEYDALLDKVMATTDVNVKKEAYGEMQKMISDNAVGVWLFDSAGNIALDNRYTGFKPYVITFWDFALIKEK